MVRNWRLPILALSAILFVAAAAAENQPSAFDNSLSPEEMAMKLRVLEPTCPPGMTCRGIRPHPALKLQVNFQFNSYRLDDASRAALVNVARALSSSDLHEDRFMVAGYTDAAGRDTSNLALSQRRAEAVVAFLEAGGVEGRRLDAVGYGRTRLADPSHPTAAINRRVEIVNLGAP